MENRQNPFSLIIVGGVMLCIGLVAGYMARPLVEQRPATTAASIPTAPAATVPPAATSAPVTAEPEVSVPEEALPSDAEREAVMTALSESTRHFKGDPDAPVTIIEFSDFQCPYCSRFAVETGTQIDEQYVETGEVRFGYQHFAFLGEGSIQAAAASECAADQDAFWPYHDRLVERVAVEQQRDFTPETLKDFAAELELDTEAFAECLDSEKYIELVQSETATAQAMGISSTPSFLVNGLFVRGAQPFSVFRRVITIAQTGEDPGE
jgi:protein-disulfide isomerase